jgi:DICT domain-containing protein
MFKQALKIAESFGVVDLGQVSYISRRNFDEQETFLFRSQVPCLEYVSLLIENAVLLRTNRTGRIYVGFEKLSRVEPIIDRYLRIADLSERVYVFGEPDWKPPRHPNMKLISVQSGSELAREWFVIAESSTLRVALVAQDEDGFDAPVLEARNFRGFKSSNPSIVTQLTTFAEGLIDSAMAA